MNKPQINDDWPCLQFAKLDCTNPTVVGRFLELLFHGDRLDEDTCNLSFDERLAIRDQRLLERPWKRLEAGWGGLSGPMQRMGQLLWEELNPNDNYRQRCVWNWRRLTEDAQNCETLLPIQARLNEVLRNFAETQKLNSSTGQADWGESFYFKDELKHFVQMQLKRVSLQLLEQDSLFKEDSQYQLKQLVHETLFFLPPVVDDDDRIYLGEVDCNSSFIWVKGSSSRELLRSTNKPYGDPQTTTWGYYGGGSYLTAESILTDVTNGNLGIAKQHAEKFLDDVLAKLPQRENFELARVQVLQWLEKYGLGREEIYRRAKTLRKDSQVHDAELKRLISISKKRIREQRFDLVPDDFEASLYADLYRIIQSEGQVMHCALCGLPLGYVRSTRGNQQRTRWKRGLPVYHPECHEQHRKDQKRVDSRERARRNRKAIRSTSLL